MTKRTGPRYGVLFFLFSHESAGRKEPGQTITTYLVIIPAMLPCLSA